MASVQHSEQNVDEEFTGLNALQENIARKGSNAYYYAHQLKGDGPLWDGDETPRLLERQVSQPTKTKHAITCYSWLDEGSKIKIYIPFKDERATHMSVKINWTESSLSVTVDLPDMQHALRIDQLYDKIASAAYKVKPGNKIVVTLTKSAESEDSKPLKWFDLKK